MLTVSSFASQAISPSTTHCFGSNSPKPNQGLNIKEATKRLQTLYLNFQNEFIGALANFRKVYTNFVVMFDRLYAPNQPVDGTAKDMMQVLVNLQKSINTYARRYAPSPFEEDKNKIDKLQQKVASINQHFRNCAQQREIFLRAHSVSRRSAANTCDEFATIVRQSATSITQNPRQRVEGVKKDIILDIYDAKIDLMRTNLKIFIDSHKAYTEERKRLLNELITLNQLLTEENKEIIGPQSEPIYPSSQSIRANILLGRAKEAIKVEEELTKPLKKAFKPVKLSIKKAEKAMTDLAKQCSAV